MSIQKFFSKKVEISWLEAKINSLLEEKPSNVKFEDDEDTEGIYGFQVSIGHEEGEKYSCIRFKLEEEITRDEKELTDQGFSVIDNCLFVINEDIVDIRAYGLPFNEADKQERIRAYLKKVELHYLKKGEGLHLNTGVREAQANVDEIEKEINALNKERSGENCARYQINEGYVTIYYVPEEYLKMEQDGIKKREKKKANEQKQTTLSSAEIIETIREQISTEKEYPISLIRKIVNRKAVMRDLDPIAEKQKSDRTKVLYDLRDVFGKTSYFISTTQNPMYPNSVEDRKIIMKRRRNK